MYIVRDIFQLRFGHYRPAKAMLGEAIQKDILTRAKSNRVLSDFTGNSYHLVFETRYDSLRDFEKELTRDMGKPVWPDGIRNL